MKRLHLFEIEDQAWCPTLIRDCVTDYLEHGVIATDAYKPIAERLAKAVTRVKANRIVDLCSGGGGPWLRMQQAIAAHSPEVEIYLTDLHQNAGAMKRVEALSSGRIKYYPHSVSALRVPPEIDGFRTLFTSFHHFKPEEARAIIRDAVESRSGIGIFEGTQRRPLSILLMLLTPLMVWTITPMIKPFRWARLLWTYLIPVVPLVVLFDGIVSCLRTYTVAELEEFTEEWSRSGYEWEIGEERAEGSPLPVTYLIGYPTEAVKTMTNEK